MQRLVNSGRIYRMENPYSVDDLSAAAHEVVRANRLNSCYIRPIVLRGYGDIGVSPLNYPIDVYMACWEWGKYLGEEALAQGVDVCIQLLEPASRPIPCPRWPRPAPTT